MIHSVANEVMFWQAFKLMPKPVWSTSMEDTKYNCFKYLYLYTDAVYKY